MVDPKPNTGQGKTKVSLTLDVHREKEKLKLKDQENTVLKAQIKELELRNANQEVGISKPVESVDEVIFWSKAKQTKIANFIPEKRAMNGDLISREGPLGFNEHLFVTTNAAEIAYMRACDAIKSGDVREVKSIDEANQLTMGIQASKTKTDHVSETTTMSTYE